MAEKKVKKNKTVVKKTAPKSKTKDKAAPATKKITKIKPSSPGQTNQTKKGATAAKSGKYGKRFLDEITKELLLMRERLLKDVSRSTQQATSLDVGDFYDKASDDRERILSLTFSERERNKLNQIEDALKRIDEGTYGICEMTGEKIGQDRLRVMPFARFTIEAQEEMEKVG
ncbi:TraR/DksA family transcriptional regulator [Candidatus Mycalebacterium sp.]